MNERQPNSLEHEDCSSSEWQHCKFGCCDWCGLPVNASERVLEQALSCSLEGGRCNIWGLLHCDDRGSPWWSSRDGPQQDRSRSDTVIISRNFNSYASFAIFFIIPVLFCFVFELETIYTVGVSVSCVWFLLPYVSLQILLSVTRFKTQAVHFVFSLKTFVSAHVMIT